jgi:mono/diheme cytochrome c family protein
MRTWASMFAAGALTFALHGLATGAAAQEKGDFDAAALFRASCAPCHGVQGAGDGPVAGALKHQLRPLSGLAARHGGEFPAAYVRDTIDGRVQVDAHGPRDMPVWGAYFVLSHKSVDGPPSLEPVESSTATIVNALVEYVRLLQQKS